MRILLAVFAFLFFFVARAQHYNFISYSFEDGLSQGQVHDICQDEQGYLWIATLSGLNRFDGIEFQHFSIDDGLPDNSISNLYISKKGKLWVSTSGGVAKFENEEEVIPFYFDKKYRINEIAELKGQIYFASNTGLIDLQDEKFSQLGTSEEKEYYLRTLVNYQDSVLICGSRSGLYVWDGQKFENFFVPGYADLNVRNLKIIEDQLYIAAREVGLLSMNLMTGKVKRFDLEYSTVSGLDVYGEGIFGITTNSGAFLIEGEDITYIRNDEELNLSGLRCVFKDLEGNIWIGADGGGLLKFLGTSIVSYTTGDQLGSNLVLSITQDSAGNFIFGTYDAGITQFREDTVVQVTGRGGAIVDNTVWTIMPDKGNIWLGTSRGLTILDQNNEEVSHPLEDISPKIRTMIRVDEQTVLMGGDEGLFILKGDSVTHVDSLNINKLHPIGDKVYCATYMGLYVFDKKTDYREFERIPLRVDKVYSLTSDFQKNLWIGTENGLFVMLSNGNIKRLQLDPSDDYRSKNIFGLTTSKDSSVWISGMKGVFQVEYAPERENNYLIRNYGRSEGLVNEETNVNAIYEDDKQNIWVGTASGLARINPALNDRLFDYKLPLVHITDVRLHNNVIDYSDYGTAIIDSTFGEPLYIELPYYENHLTFDFIGINLKDPKAVRYEFKLIGLDESWSSADSRSNHATYSYLQPGEYTFQVRAMNKNKKWSEVCETKVVIKSPFWKTWLFITNVALVILVIIILIFRSRIRALKQKQDNEKLELKNRLLFLEQRSLNASMNRHFIFNSLNSIQYFINGSDKLSANRFLSNFAKLIRMNLDSSAANNFIVTLQEEIERIELYLSLEKMRFSDKFEYTVDVSSELDTESIEIPSMILQPFVENSIIHGVLSLEDKKGEISVKIFQEFGEVVFEVTDNGQGIDNSLSSKQNRLEGDHESKGVEITNRRIELLRKLTGENLLIVGPFQMNDEEGQCLGTKVILKLGGTEKFQE